MIQSLCLAQVCCQVSRAWQSLYTSYHHKKIHHWYLRALRSWIRFFFFFLAKSVRFLSHHIKDMPYSDMWKVWTVLFRRPGKTRDFVEAIITPESVTSSMWYLWISMSFDSASRCIDSSSKLKNKSSNPQQAGIVFSGIIFYLLHIQLRMKCLISFALKLMCFHRTKLP